MKKITKTLLVASLALMAMSCSKEDKEVVTPVQENNVPNGTSKLSLSVHVLASSTGSVRTAGLNGCTVTISNNGVNKTVTVDESGIAYFGNLTEGSVSVFVKAPSGYLSRNTSGFIEYDGSFSLTSTGTNGGTDAIQESSSRIAVTLPRIGATFKGKILGNFDFDGSTSNTPIVLGTKIIARVSNSLEPNIFTTTTNSDGSFTFANSLPEGEEVSFSLDYQTTNSTVTPNTQKDWEFQGLFGFGDNSSSFQYGETKEIGNTTAQ